MGTLALPPIWKWKWKCHSSQLEHLALVEGPGGCLFVWSFAGILLSHSKAKKTNRLTKEKEKETTRGNLKRDRQQAAFNVALRWLIWNFWNPCWFSLGFDWIIKQRICLQPHKRPYNSILVMAHQLKIRTKTISCRLESHLWIFYSSCSITLAMHSTLSNRLKKKTVDTKTRTIFANSTKHEISLETKAKEKSPRRRQK